MTVAVVCSGPDAGRAALEALAHVEKVGRGAIGGFAHLALVLTKDGTGCVVRIETQRHGSTALYQAIGEGEYEGVMGATVAALISSGPDRPTPLSQFVAADPSGCVATGHRMPQAMGKKGKTLVVDALERMLEGQDSCQAVRGVMVENAHADAGIIGADLEGRVYAQNSDRVLRRPDVGHARRQQGDIVVEVLANSIGPEGQAIAELAAAIAMEVMSPNKPNNSLWLGMGTPVEFAEEDAIVVEEIRGLAYISCVRSTDPLANHSSREEVALIGPQTAVIWQGGKRFGTCCSEPFMVIDKGRLVSCDGQEFYEVRYRGTCDCMPADPDHIFALTHSYPPSDRIWRSPSASDFCFPGANLDGPCPTDMGRGVKALGGDVPLQKA